MSKRFSSDKATELLRTSRGLLNLDAAIIHMLTHSVRLISDYQLPSLQRQQARQLLRRLETQGLVQLKTVMTHAELSLSAPLVVWQPGEDPPLYDRVAWQLASRWQGKWRTTMIASPTKLAQLITGGPLGMRPLRRTEIVHDLHVTGLFLKFVQEVPARARYWIHEDANRDGRAKGELIPDAMIGLTAIEFGGRYRADKLRAIHRGHAMAERPYEIW